MANRLAQETSPYLKQHQDNPVDWYPWGEEALKKARDLNRPILLSVGYSACHWCHVMAHECFENPEIAGLMNEHFINIKVDREERPDLDQIYQTVAQAITHSGGWPLTVFLTPDLRPFYGGTYFPPEDRYGRPGFGRVLLSLSQAFRQESPDILENAIKLTEVIRTAESPTSSPPPQLTGELITSAADKLLGQVDWENGGMGGAPKFPNPMVLSFLWRSGQAFRKSTYLDAVILSLRKMAQGGIYDQLGGGFHRYSVDESWSVPHFEKMLYDNALLLKLYAEVLLTDTLSTPSKLEETDLQLFQDVLAGTVNYVFSEMTHPSGLFYSAQDADSEGEEGKYFVWDSRDLASVLSPDQARLVKRAYGVADPGNFEHGKTVLSQLTTVTSSEREQLECARLKLLEARRLRVAPGLDDKVLTSWNGLMISGMLWAGAALRSKGSRYLGDRASRAAKQAYSALMEVAREPNRSGRLFSTVQLGQPRFNAYLDDYAFLAQAALDLSRLTQDEAERRGYLMDAEQWCDVIRMHFGDPRGGGYFFTSDDHEALIHRPKSCYDQTIPSGTAVALQCMSALTEIDPSLCGQKFKGEVERVQNALSSEAARGPYGKGEALSALLLSLAGPVVVSGVASEAALQYQVYQGSLTAQPPQICHRQTCQSIGSMKLEMVIGQFFIVVDRPTAQ